MHRDNAAEAVLALTQKNISTARAIIADLDIEGAWRSIGAEVNLVGSLKIGLLGKHRDIDFHVYTPAVLPAESFRAMGRIAANPRIERIEYGNLIDTEEECIEWHAHYRDTRGETWQLDIIHIRRGSAYDGFAERAAEKIAAALTPQTRATILRLKYETPDNEKIMGIEYYLAVLRDGVTSYAEFTAWRAAHPLRDIVLWTPE